MSSNNTNMNTNSTTLGDAALPTTAAPHYESPDGPPPSYCLTAYRGEEVLALTHIPNIFPTPDGSFTQNFGRVSVTLTGQEDDSTVPSYGTQAIISGTVDIENPEDILRVELQIQGNLKLLVTGTNSVSKNLDVVDENLQLWSRQNSTTAAGSNDTGSSVCPKSIPFSTVLPLQFHEEEPTPHDSYLPPSYEVDITGLPGLLVKSAYAIRITVVNRGTLWDKRKSFCLPFIYRPRRRPPQPTLPNSAIDGSLLDTLKVHPDEWFQTASVLETRPSTKLPPLHVQLIIPSLKIFGLSDTIPFHIQIIGSKASLNEFYEHLDCAEEEVEVSTSETSSLASDSLIRVRSSSSSKAKVVARKKRDDHLLLTMSVTIQRQVNVSIKGQQVWRTQVLGVGKIHAVPPSFECRAPSSASFTGSNAGEGSGEGSKLKSTSDSGCPYAPEEQSFLRCLDWEGEIRCKDDVSVGSFNSGRLCVKDFLILTITPKPHQNQSAFLALKTALPVTLVTDSWNDGVL